MGGKGDVGKGMGELGSVGGVGGAVTDCEAVRAPLHARARHLPPTPADAPNEHRTDLSSWLPLPCATALDVFMVELANDLQAAATQGSVLSLRLRVVNSQRSTGKGLHWFTVAYGLEPLETMPVAVTTAAGKRRAVEAPSVAAVGTVVDSDVERASDASDADDSSFISDDGEDWRAQINGELVTSVDPYHARIEAGLDPGAGADDEAEDDVDMDDRPVRHCRFLDDMAGEESD